MASDPVTPATSRLLKLSEVARLTGKSRSSIYGDERFPRPLKIGRRSSAWLESEVLAWIAARVAERDAGGVGG